MLSLASHSLTALKARALASGLTHEELAALAVDPRQGARRLAYAIEARMGAQAAEMERLLGMLRYEQALWRAGQSAVAGVDEVGVGPLAGPVVAAAVILSPGTSIEGVNDSKKLSAKKRAQLDVCIRREAVAWAVGMCSAQEIDARNIFVATREAARRAVAALSCAPGHVLVDAHAVPRLNVPQTPIVEGDCLSQSIAAASIVAKVARDRLMCGLDARYPGYGFAQHAGYGTAQHLAALKQLGACPEHRRSFSPVAAAVAKQAPAAAL